MKLFHVGKLLAVATGVAMAIGTPQTAEAAKTKVIDGVTHVHPRFKGAEGAGWVPLRSTRVATNERRESVAGFRVETDEQGRSWVWRHPRFKGAEGAGWVKVPVDQIGNE